MKTKKAHFINSTIPGIPAIQLHRWIFGLLLIISVSICNAQVTKSELGMVASAHPLASSAGIEILKKGGNAVDAAVATACALAVVEPNASGLGGGGFMLIKMKGSEQPIVIDYRETAPGAVNPATYYQSKESFTEFTQNSPMAVGTPGSIAGWTLALEKYGTMALAQVAEPAIRYANQGFIVSEKFAAIILQNYELILNNPATAALFLNNGLPAEQGMLIKNPDLAQSFQKLSSNGAAIFYAGEIANTIIEQIHRENGILKKDDLQKYHAIIRKPVRGSYRGFDIVSSSPPAAGGTHLIELLNILEQYDLQRFQCNSAEYIHILAEAMKMVFADKEVNMADPAFYNVPVTRLTDKNYAANLSKRIKPDTVSADYKPPAFITRESGSTTHLSVVDEQRNVIALTQSINKFFGSGITVKGTGLILNNHLADFSPDPANPNSIEPYKRPVSNMAPTILLKDGVPVLTIGTPGGLRIISALCQVIINIVDFGMNIDDAIEAPRVHAFGDILELEGRIPQAVGDDLEKLGHKIKYHDGFDNYFGGVQGIFIDVKNKKLYGGCDSRRDGVAIGF
ncbi:gamma-glutamyltransferase [candidate division KSB1 bacterium]|nr:gamma-glutamyltransferase [candidate division KSB1 bacterium]